MSALTRCNYCSLEAIRRDVAVVGATVMVSSEPAGIYSGEPWIEVYRSDQPRRVAWFMALTDHCVC